MMASTTGFVPSAGTACLGSSSFTETKATTSRRTRFSRATAVPQRRAVLRMQDATPEKPSEKEVKEAVAEKEVKESAEKVEETAIPPEPYPGFYADMQRAGLSDEEAQAQAFKVQVRKNPELAKSSGKIGGERSLIGADGKALAPWMTNVRTDLDRKIIKNKTDAKGKLAGDPQNQELSGQGLRWKLLGDELELTWATGAEENNRGFIVTRRQGKTDMWQSVSDYKDRPAELASKGPQGGSYSFLMPVEPGSWVYRVSDEDGTGKVSDLSQTLVDIDDSADSSNRLIALGGLLVVLFGFVAFSLLTDPLSGPS